MRRVTAALLIALAAPIVALAATPVNVVPAPRSVTPSSGAFHFDGMAVIIPQGPARESGLRFAELISRTHGIRAYTDNITRGPAIRFKVDRASRIPREGYRLSVRPQGIDLAASTSAGLAHGAATLWQLIEGEGRDAKVASVDIEDAPRFAWRGVMLDSARHYQSPEFLRRFIDWMALHKLNVLHWHLTDDQAWRLEIRKYPRLTEVGAWRVPAGPAARADIDPATGKPRLHGGYYSQEMVRELVAYAARRGITIVPEIEMPGHATAAIAAYPELSPVEAPPREVPADWGIYPHVYSLEESTFRFLEDVLREVMALFPSRYIHVGGDEVEPKQWAATPRGRARMRELGIDDPAKVQPYFTQRIARFLAANKRRLVGWDEILTPGLEPSAVVMSWRGIDGALTAANRGHDTILAAHPTLYFDNRQSAAESEPPGRGRIVSLQDVYAFEPMPAGIAPERQRHVLGLQANVWTEHIRTEERAAHMTFPRAAAVAELGWSQPEQRDWGDFSRRVAVLQGKYAKVGLGPSTSPSVRPEPAEGHAATSRSSRQLALCSEHIALALEDDAPLAGPRAIFLADIQDPCWQWKQADLSGVRAIGAAVGQVPFNFQIGEDVHKIRFPKPTTVEGELEVRVGGCEGEVLARLPLAPARHSHAVASLAPAPIAPREGRHDLCMRFAQPALEPLWLLDRIELRKAAP